MSKVISDYAQVEIPTKLKKSSECTTAVARILNLIIKIRILLSGAVGPSRHGQTPSSTGWSTYQLLVALHELCVLPTQSHFL